jgi:hypothetical protein
LVGAASIGNMSDCNNIGKCNQVLYCIKAWTFKGTSSKGQLHRRINNCWSAADRSFLAESLFRVKVTAQWYGQDPALFHAIVVDEVTWNMQLLEDFWWCEGIWYNLMVGQLSKWYMR